MRYFTSDLHFHHPFVAALRGYAYKDVDKDAFDKAMEAHDGKALAGLVDWERHDGDIVDNIMESLGKDDDLFILGDISSGGKESLDSAIEDLKSLKMPRKRMHLILGNHEDLDMRRSKMDRYLEVFGEVSRTGVVSISGSNVVMSHFQFKDDFKGVQYNGMSENTGADRYVRYAVVDDMMTLLLHGHTHAKTPFEFGNPREMNVGVDAWDMKPVSENDIRSMLDIKDTDHEKLVDMPFLDFLDSFLRGSYRDKTAPIRKQKREYDERVNAIITDDSISGEVKTSRLAALKGMYSKTVLNFADNEDKWCERSEERVMDAVHRTVGGDTTFFAKEMDYRNMALTARMVGDDGEGSIRVRMASPTSRMSAHIVISTDKKE